MKRKSRSTSKIPGASRLVGILVSNACQIMEVIICDKLYQKAEPQNIRDILEWFFLDRRYRHLMLLTETRKGSRYGNFMANTLLLLKFGVGIIRIVKTLVTDSGHARRKKLSGFWKAMPERLLKRKFFKFIEFNFKNH